MTLTRGRRRRLDNAECQRQAGFYVAAILAPVMILYVRRPSRSAWVAALNQHRFWRFHREWAEEIAHLRVAERMEWAKQRAKWRAKRARRHR